MKKEWQVIDVNDQNWSADLSGLVLGDEGCIYRALDERWSVLLEKGLEKGLTIRFLTPLVPNKHMEELVQRIRDYSEHTQLKVTFNDLGLLERCHDLIQKQRIYPVVGRILTRSFLDCPWHKDLLSNEDPNLVDEFVGYTYAHQAKWDILHQYGIKELEINYHDQKHIEELHESGFSLTTYKSNLLISIGRLCYSARWHGLQLPECHKDDRCRKKLQIELDKLWGKSKLMYEEPTPFMKSRFSQLYILGNAVYQPLFENKMTDLNFIQHYIV